MLAEPQHRTLAAILRRFISPIGTMATHGIARFTLASGELTHEATEISLQPAKAESAEKFIARVCGEAAEGDQVEFRMRDGQLVSALITRRAALPLQMAPGETFEAFALRVRNLKNAPRA